MGEGGGAPLPLMGADMNGYFLPTLTFDYGVTTTCFDIPSMSPDRVLEDIMPRLKTWIEGPNCKVTAWFKRHYHQQVRARDTGSCFAVWLDEPYPFLEPCEMHFRVLAPKKI